MITRIYIYHIYIYIYINKHIHKKKSIYIYLRNNKKRYFKFKEKMLYYTLLFLHTIMVYLDSNKVTLILKYNFL